MDGEVNDQYRFQGLVFAEHADVSEYELGRSRISKLWVRDTTTRTTVFRFERRLDIPAAGDEVQVIVDFHCEGLADEIFA